MEMAVGILIVCIFEITDPLYLPLKWGGLVCLLLESPVGSSANCIFIQLRSTSPVWKIMRWI